MSLEQNSTNSFNIVLSVDILTAEQAAIFLLVNFSSLCCILSLLGIIGNVINIIVFLKQGFRNTINICFFGLAISDICCLLTLLWMGVCLNPAVIVSGAPWVATDFVYLTGAWPHNMSGRITSYITVYITAERCVCIIFPLKVKQLISPRKTTVAVCTIYILNILTLCPEYATSYLTWKFFPERNITLLAIAHRSGREQTAGIVFFLNSITGAFSFVSVIVLTAILAVKLKKASVWRLQAKSANSNTVATMSSRDQKTVKMVTLIATVLIICFIPGVIVAMVTFIEPEFDLRKRYANSVASFWSLASVGQAVNSSINIIFYYKMSSKYKQTFAIVFRACCRNDSILLHVVDNE